MAYRCVYFKIEELVDRSTLMTLGEDACWKLFDEKVLILIDKIRKFFGRPMVINNWSTGGRFSQRGFRGKTSATGAPKSAHKNGQALDFDVVGLTAQFVRNSLILNRDKLFPEMTEIEMTIKKVPINWNHVSVRPTGIKELKLLHC